MFILYFSVFAGFGILYNFPSIYDVATEVSNVPKGKGEARSVYAVLCEVADIYSNP